MTRRKILSEPLYYLQCTSHYAFDYILWWRPDAKGYTHNLAEAGLYTEEDARSHVRCRGLEVAWHKDDVLKFTDQAVSIEKLRRHCIEPAMKPKVAAAKREKKPHPRNCTNCGKLFSMVNNSPDVEECGRCT